MSTQADPDSQPLHKKRRRRSQANVCERCGLDAGAESVMVEAATIAQYLYTLMLCGVCWSMLKHAIDWELAGAGPGGHVELVADELGQAGEPGDYPNGSPLLGDIHRTD
jgi:hypothetical protein